MRNLNRTATETSVAKKKEVFYEQLNTVLKRFSKGNIAIVMEDLDGKIDSDSIYESVERTSRGWKIW